MATRIDLNIVDRGTVGSGWVAQDTGLTADSLDKVTEQKTDNSSALNSLPTPFARFFVAREAFRRAKEEHLNAANEAGFAYRQMVSDILDVFELMFNLKYHQNNTWLDGQRIEVREWNSTPHLADMKAKMPKLYNSVNDYYKSDIAEERLYFVVFTEEGKDLLLGCSSPYTGFVTPPDMDKAQVKRDGVTSLRFASNIYEHLHIRRKSGGEYFRDVKMLDERDAEFKNYMYNTLFGTESTDARLKAIKEYVRSFASDRDIRNDFEQKLVSVSTDQNDSLTVNGLRIMSSDDIDLNSFFTPTIIRLPYRIGRDRFKTVNYQNDAPGRHYDYLLPFKPEVLALFGKEEICTSLHINRSSVSVSLTFNGKTCTKEYSDTPLTEGTGRIYDMEAAHTTFDLGVFPNILSGKEQENNYFKVTLLAADKDDEARQLSIDRISLSFFRDGRKIDELDPEASGAQFSVRPAVVRSRQHTDEADSGTKLYELYNTPFEAIEVNVMGHTGLLLPAWERSRQTPDTYTYAIDLGTSNTFISRTKDGENNKPEMFAMLRPMVSFLHEVPEGSQLPLARRIEDSLFTPARNRVRTEFVPALIDGTDYRFPIRTALCGVRSTADDARLFDNHNIAFSYERLMPFDDQDIRTDIKWEKSEALLRVFIRELLLIIKCDVLQRGGDLDRTRLVWFRPLSFMGNTRDTYQRIWREEPQSVLFVQPSQVSCFSESEAPYYYFKKKNLIKDSDAVAVVDIGGGSTDYVYFKDNHPVMASSVHFGCDVLWENGFVEFDNDRQNGIYRRYADTLRFKRDDLERLNENFKHIDNAKTKDIINFWLSNASACDISQCLNADFKPVFVYHLTAILFYMALMYKDNGCEAPHTIVFSGNGSRYIDGFISADTRVLTHIANLVFARVFGGEHNVHLVLPEERKESTCYGGLYRDPSADDVPEKVYQGDMSEPYEKVGDINRHFPELRRALNVKYNELTAVYKDVLDILKRDRVIDATADTAVYVEAAAQGMDTALNTYYKTQVKERFADEVMLYDSVFFLPVVDKVFEMTKIC